MDGWLASALMVNALVGEVVADVETSRDTRRKHVSLSHGASREASRLAIHEEERYVSNG